MNGKHGVKANNLNKSLPKMDKTRSVNSSLIQLENETSRVEMDEKVQRYYDLLEENHDDFVHFLVFEKKADL